MTDSTFRKNKQETLQSERVCKRNVYWIPLLFIAIRITTAEKQSEEILCLTPPLAGRGSHLSLMTTLCDALVQGNLNSTLLIQGPGTPAPRNTTVLRHSSAFDSENIEAYADQFTAKSLDGNFGIFDLLGFVQRLAEDCNKMMSDDELFELLQKANFTIAIVDHFYFCGIIYAHRLRLPTVVLDSSSYFSVLDSGVPNPLSYIPMYNSELTNNMNFWERTMNTIAYLGIQLMFRYFRAPFLDIARKHNITDSYGGNNFFGTAELWLLNSDFSLEFSRPILPNMVYIGGYTAREARSLHEPFLSLVDTHVDGTIVVSFGSFYSSLLPSLEKTLADTFSELPQLIIWKQNISLPLSENIETFNWIPQNDLLGHPKTVLLVSHCGMNSIMEAIYHGVPVVCIPFQGDQIDNGVRVKAQGLGLTIPPKSLTTARLEEAIHTVITEQKFKTKAVYLSAMFHEQPQKPIDRAVFAINRAIKFPNQIGRSMGLELNLLQYHMVDVIAVLLLLFSSLIVGLIFATKQILKKICVKYAVNFNGALFNKQLSVKKMN